MGSIQDKSITEIKGIGESKRALFANAGIHNIYDLLSYFPKDYEDRSGEVSLSDLEEDDYCFFKAIVVSKATNFRVRRNLSIQKVKVRNETGTVSCVWYNRPYLSTSMYPGNEYSFYGKVQRNRGVLEIMNPEYERTSLEDDGYPMIVPIYPLVAGLSQTMVRKTVKKALEMCEGQFEELLPEKLRKDHGLAGIEYSFKNIHYPESIDAQSEARKRFVFEELFFFQLALVTIKEKDKDIENYIKFKPVPDVKMLEDRLPFKLTNSQKRSLVEIEDDMESEHVMNRLLQGDVGSGKTVVALLAAVKAIKNGYQVSLMVPTEILAKQHLETFIGLLNGFADIKVELLTGSATKKKKEEILDRVNNGDVDILIGTHSLIEKEVDFKNLGLVITDEQHRFGVKQREKIITKGNNADILVMSATPIPRTLALILYGDLDISVIDELPAGRKEIKTYCVDDNMRPRINNFMRKNVTEGRQIFVVCPFIEESMEIDGQSAEELYENLRDNVFPDLNVDILHGRMKNKEKEATMNKFILGETNILVSTTIVEVGVNIPNASLMIIENAERFGLSQLHQLRGRIGRGEYESFCILFSNSKTDIATERFKIMVESNDGFEISEKDMQLRGPGDFFGTKQHGIPQLKIANLYKDVKILEETNMLAQAVASDKILTVEQCEKLKKIVVDRFYNRLDVVVFS